MKVNKARKETKEDEVRRDLLVLLVQKDLQAWKELQVVRDR